MQKSKVFILEGKGRGVMRNIKSKRNLKDKKIIIYKKQTIKDNAGFASTVYKPIHPGRLWAYVRQLSASEYYASMALQQKEEMIYTINWRSDVTAGECFIEYKGVFYDVKRVDTFEGYKEDLKLYTLQMVSQPGAGDVGVWDG